MLLQLRAADAHRRADPRRPIPLQGLVSGSLDLDKIEYLNRDALFCGVPYGEVDVDRLLHALLILCAIRRRARWKSGVHEKGVAALESLLFAKYQMFRNVYWHHAVRAGDRAVQAHRADAVESGLLTPEELVGQTDEGLLSLLETRSKAQDDERSLSSAGILAALRARRFPKRAPE